ncbi:MAG: PAS domain S-box protein [Deltaproteobacteria bacterium]|nr:PAS domain S-box protein [Deltaproteobacteria bacterium]
MNQSQSTKQFATANLDEQFRFAFANSPIGLALCNSEGICIEANYKMISMLEYSISDIKGKVIASFAYADDSILITEKQQQLNNTQTNLVFESRFKTNSGNIFWAEVNIFLIQDINSGPAYFLISILDITKLKSAETEISYLLNLQKEEKAFAESIVQTAQAIVLVLSPFGKIVTFNPYLEKLSGWSLKEVIGRDWFDVFLPQKVREYTRELFQRAIADSPTQGNIDCIVTRDGRELYIEWYDKTLKDSNGYITGLLSVGQDVTARKKVEETLNYQKMLLESQNQASLDGIINIDVQGRILWHNRRFVDMWGIPQEVLAVGHEGAILNYIRTQIRDPDTFLDKLNNHNVLEDSRSQNEFYSNDGRVFDCYCSPMMNDEGKLLGRVCVFRDITERKLAETERQQLQTRLAQSDRLSSMGMLAAGVAHEINNPLSYVLYNIESLVEDIPKLSEFTQRCHAALLAQVGQEDILEILGDTQRVFDRMLFDDVSDRLRDALSGAYRIKNISRSLGTFSRVEHNRLAPVNIQTCIEHAAAMGFNEIKYRARFVKDFSQVPLVLASDGKLAQVFLNLLINAAHSIDEGHVSQNEVRVRTWSIDDKVFAEVSDTGKGIAPENQKKIFDPFFSTKGIGVGTGLGLSICKNIIEEFGGTISFTSELGKGTKFLIILPRLPEDWDKNIETNEIYDDSEKSSIRGRILIIDDEASIRSSINKMLRHEHNIISVESGLEAKDLIEKDQNFDLIFCDLMMPEMSGMELHSWLTKHHNKLAEQVVFITGGAFTPGASEYLSKVGNLRLEKPFDTKNFKKITNELLLASKSRNIV